VFCDINTAHEAKMEWDDRYRDTNKRGKENRFLLSDAPQSVSEIKSLKGRGASNTDVDSALRFQVLWREAQARAKERGWSSNFGSRCQLYVPSHHAKRVWLSPIGGTMRCQVVPAPGGLAALVDRLNSAMVPGLGGVRFAHNDGNAEASVKLDRFLAGAETAEAMACRLADALVTILTVLEEIGVVPVGKAEA
jgi:hypothetical protein